MYKKLIIALVLLAAIILPVSAAATFSPTLGTEVFSDDQLQLLTLVTSPPGGDAVRYFSAKCSGGPWSPNCGSINATYFGSIQGIDDGNPQTIPFNLPSDVQMITFDIRVGGTWYSGQSQTGGWWRFNSTIIPKVNVTFSISEAGNFTKKLSGVAITLSNGQTNTTGADGIALIRVNPASSAYNYALSKSGYYSEFGALGGYGETGGTAYYTMEPETGGIPPGYYRTTVFATDGSTGNKILGATLNLRDVENNTWINGTSSATGLDIDVLPTHTLDIYGSYPGYYLPSQETGAVPGGNYYLPIYPIVPTPVGGVGGGYVNLFVNVQDSETLTALNYAVVSVHIVGGATTGESTGTSGSILSVVPNNTAIILGVSKTGYGSVSETINSGPGPDVSKTIKLTKNYISPTATWTPGPTWTGGTTPPPTLEPYLPYCDPSQPDYNAELCTGSQDSNLMSKLREQAPDILDLAIVAVIFGLLSMIFGSITRFGK